MRARRARAAAAFLTAIAAMAVAGVASAWAISPEYKFEGSGALNEERKAPTQNFVLGWEGSAEVECSAVKLEGASLVANSKNASVHALRFESCVVRGSSTKCEVSPIVTNPLKSTLSGPASAVQEKFEASSGEQIGILTIKNRGEQTCLAKGKFAIDGSFTTVHANDEAPSSEHTVSFNVAAQTDELRIGAAGPPAYLTGAFGEKLQTTNLWSIA